jgi:two-component system, OmpR family, phosphate regulon sensor histidine kinase PhoR
VKLGIRGQLLLLFCGLVGISMFIANTYLSRQLEDLLLDRIRSDLIVRLELLEREVSALDASLSSFEVWDRVADEYARRSLTRVTLIRQDGVVIGDSAKRTEELASMESFASRPEFTEAIAFGFGSAARDLGEEGERMLFVAVPFRREDVIQGVVRIGIPVSETDAVVAELGRVLIFGWLIAFGVAVLLSVLGAHLGSRRVSQVRAAARRMSEGDLSVRTKVGGDDEIAELGKTLDRLAESLDGTLHALRADRNLMGAVLSNMGEGVIVLDEAGRVMLANPALHASFSLDANVIGRAPADVFSQPCVVAFLKRAREAKGPIREEVSCGSPERHYLVHATELSSGDEKTLAVFVDVTELRRLESVRREFVANASHELRTPITIIKSAAEASRVEIRKDVEATARFIEIIDRNSDRLRRLVDDLLALTKVESAEFRLNLEPMPIDALVSDVLGSFQERASKKRIHLDSALPSKDLLVLADRKATEEVLGNLVDNALKYCTDGSEVKVQATFEGETLRIAVEDTGPGIEEKHLPRLFERFYRVDLGRSRDVGGTGLGLAIVKHLVEAMRGRVGVESVPGKGSRFWFTLPRAMSPATKNSSASA